MSTLRQIRHTLAAQLEAALDIRAYEVWPASVNPPIAVVRPLSGSFQEVMGSVATHQIEVTLLLQLGHQEAAQEDLDAYLDPDGAKSVCAAIVADPTLGGTVSSSIVRGYRDYGGMTIGVDPEGRGPEYLGVHFDIEVFP